MSKTSKIKELIISESHDQCPRYSVTFIYILLVLARVSNNFPKPVIFLLIWCVFSTSRQTYWNFENIRGYNFWVTQPVPKILNNLYQCPFSIDETPSQFSKGRKIRDFHLIPRQTEQNFKNKRTYNLWVTWPVCKILMNLYLYSFCIS